MVVLFVSGKNELVYPLLPLYGYLHRMALNSATLVSFLKIVDLSSCVVFRPQYFAAFIRFGSHGPGRSSGIDNLLLTTLLFRDQTYLSMLLETN